ncbi:protein-disulfide reductase DsbD domain-containing protein [Rhizobium sp. C4]|uniref:protein-disulfide reductase DsbD domain-containing protein n=1 Tax=Rhizobium sp. C4 TaxID=1349800 RepID=UPI001E2B9E91|nr:protein-disulfide reductase DsbD domain-containing protein [Rhizobium sp. C4]MCD2173013.1 cytochrome C biogenesis protein [Rhizobium sp. C4]
MMKRFTTLINRFILVSALAALPLPALAASSDWIGTKGGKLRLVALPPDAGGTIRGFVEIAPDDGWHTYWKVPGSGGIPPQITLKDGGNVRLETLDFPAPRVFDDGKLRDFGYDARVMLPLTLKQEKPGELSQVDASIFIGLCADICVPFQAEVSLRVSPDDKPKPAEAALVNAANALLPEAPSADFAVEDARATEDGQGAVLKLRLPAGTDAAATDLVIVAPDGQPLGRPKRLTTEQGALVAEVRQPGGGTAPLAGKSLDVLVLAGSRAMETTVTVK